MAHCNLKAIPVFEIKYLVSMLRSIKQQAFLIHPVFTPTDVGEGKLWVKAALSHQVEILLSTLMDLLE